MRQGQQNHRRGRGRGRKGHHNPLARSYESTGPDVKIRGTASHIAEKYMALARDATASGDLVMAENYLQHAEHYNRIIMAAQAQLRADDPNGNMQHRVRPSQFEQPIGEAPDGEDWGEDDGEGGDQPSAAYAGAEQPQPRFQDEPQNYGEQPQPRLSELPPFVERSVFGGQGQPGHEPSQSRAFEPRQPRHGGQEGRQEHRGEGREGRGPRRRGRYDNGGGRHRHGQQERQPAADAAPSDVNGTPFAEPVRRDNPETSDND